MPITKEDLNWVPGSNNTPGISKVGFVDVEDIDTEPQPIQSDPTGNGSFSDLVTTTGDLYLKNGRRMSEIYVTMGKNALIDDVAGPTDSGYNSNELTFFVPGDKANARGFATWVKNNKLVFIVQDKEGVKYIFGSKLFPAVRKEIKGTSGAKGGDEKGRTFTFMTEGPRPYLEFKGNVVDGKGTSASADDVKQEIFYS
jgi:hypothetical protein